nr:MAG TPA: hypothetical protein [Caudoviricetes sp.]
MKNGKYVYGEGKHGKWYCIYGDEGYDDKEEAMVDGLDFSMSHNMPFVYIGKVQDNSVIEVEEIETKSLLNK